MVSQIIKYLAGSIFSLWIISVLIFFLSKFVPGDRIQDQLNVNFETPFEIAYEKEYEQKARELFLDKASFYFSILPAHFPSELNNTFPKSKKERKKKLLFEGYGNDEANRIIYASDNLVRQVIEVDKLVDFRSEIDHLSRSSTREEITTLLTQIESKANEDKIRDSSRKLRVLIRELEADNIVWIPKLFFHGLDNQYHIWIRNLLSGNPGNSYQDGKAVQEKIGKALSWTLFLVIISLILSYIFGILIGVSLAMIKKPWIKKIIERILFGIYAIPLFWLATLLLVFFTTREYGAWTNIFPRVGLAPIDSGEPWYITIGNYGNQIILPCFCLVIHNLAFLGSLTKRNMEKYKNEAFVLTSRAFGFSEGEILFREVLPHALLPLITSFTSAVPAAIGGSLIIEIIFNIPGMGRLLYNGILNYDWPVVFTIVMLVAVITIVSYLLAEVLYRIADPRLNKMRDA